MFQLLTNSNKNGGDQTASLVMIIVLIGVFVAYMVYSNYQQKKRQKETQDTLNAIQPGHKVKTIGGICGVVVEVCPDDNTIVVETGTEKSGKSYIKFDKQAIYQTDATAKKEETPVATEEPAPAVEETPVVEETTETNE